MVVVRESNGLLRKADYDEREKMLQVYFPRLKKTMHTPQLFKSLNLEVKKQISLYCILTTNVFTSNDVN